MSSKRSRRQVTRRTSYEPLEDRQMFSAEPLGGLAGGAIEQHAVSEPDFWYDTNLERELDALVGDLEQTLAAANEMTGLTQARDDYGFLGYGQTVAVIDSGIAWDHPNLGGGFGSDYRVVGGWDFTYENDADPYDDGPSGAHGTHVSGIIGATANSTGDEGVAPGVDLVGLRVFNDQGAGYFNWVENALRWVHTNRNNFANPITAVNLSLGTAWNAATIPSWAMLEDEFAQLEADGIFISVSAGNSFTSYNTPGLSYPAVSSSVVPVMSVDDNGSLSYFSQRHDRAIAAPGRTIRSTVPDYVGNQNGKTDDWASFSGTSMASPYVAGASVLIREAMEFVGYVGINQDTIYDHMRATADNVWDAATNAFYKRLNLGAAIDALMPEDDFGSTAGTAFNLGTIRSDGAAVSGTVGKSDDVDFFRFTAAATGTVTFTAATTHYLDAAWTGGGTVSADGLSYTIDVAAGQSYAVGLSTTEGVGHFQLDVTAESTFSFVDWGTVTQQQRLQVGVNGEAWYGVTAQQAGYLTAEAFITPSCQLELAWFDSNMQQVATGTADAHCLRADRLVGAGEQLYLRVSGSGDAVDFRLTNLVSVDGPTLEVTGTDGDDTMSFTAGAIHQIVVNGVAYEIDATTVGAIHFEGGGGYDSISMTGTSGNESVELRAGSAEMNGSGFTVSASDVESITVEAGGGDDEAMLYDSTGDDRFYALPEYVWMQGANNEFDNFARGFDRVSAHATAGGVDRAMFHDSVNDDVFTARPDWARMVGSDFETYAHGFEANHAYATKGGLDRAIFHDSAGDDVFTLRPESSRMIGAGYANYANGFDANYGYATLGGLDRAIYFDSAGDDRFYALPEWSRMTGDGYNNAAAGFDANYAYAQAGGLDRAYFYDSSDDDRFEVAPGWSRLWGTGFNSFTTGFDANYAFATAGGLDRAIFHDSVGNDLYEAGPGWARMTGSGFNWYARGFAANYAYSGAGGLDRAILHDSAGNDRLEARLGWSRLVGSGFASLASGFQSVRATSVGGADEAVFDQIGTLDTFSVETRTAALRGSLVSVDALGFDRVTAHAKDGESPSANLVAVDCALSLVGGWA